MVYFQTKNPSWGKFGNVLQWKIFMSILSILRPKVYILWQFGTFCAHLVYFSRFGMLYRKKILATLQEGPACFIPVRAEHLCHDI
jgi:hypothetical protein